jgi:glutathione S-transferase
MMIFGSTLSPFVRKTAAFLREKGLAFDLQPSGIPNPSP